MPFQLRLEERDGYLLCVITGSLASSAELHNYAEQVLTRAEKVGKKRILLDEQALSGCFDMVEIAEFAKTMNDNKLALARMRIAVLRSRRRTNTTPEDVERMLQNRFISYRLFEDQSEAEAWLAEG